jgi:hypothetical protein
MRRTEPPHIEVYDMNRLQIAWHIDYSSYRLATCTVTHWCMSMHDYINIYIYWETDCIKGAFEKKKCISSQTLIRIFICNDMFLFWILIHLHCSGLIFLGCISAWALPTAVAAAVRESLMAMCFLQSEEDPDRVLSIKELFIISLII